MGTNGPLRGRTGVQNGRLIELQMPSADASGDPGARNRTLPAKNTTQSNPDVSPSCKSVSEHAMNKNASLSSEKFPSAARFRAALLWSEIA
jgi:hypothetical protein